MLRHIKHLSFNLTKSLKQQPPLRLFGTKPSRYYTYKKDKEEEDDRKSKVGEEERLHLLKSRGQHLLTNPRVLDTIIRRAEINPTDTVLEIGPGTGNLTMRLLEAAQKVIAVEIDTRMVEALSKRVAEHGFEDRIMVICKDALRTELPQFDLIVANIPYGISSPLIAKLVFGDYQFRSATLLLQKEFARRLLAKPGDSSFNRLAVNVQLVADVEFIMDVSKRDFVPCPKVDSSVVKIYPKDKTPDVDMDEWWDFTRACFNKKNKTLGAIFKQKKKLVELLKRSLTINEDEDKCNSFAHCNYHEEQELHGEAEQEYKDRSNVVSHIIYDDAQELTGEDEEEEELENGVCSSLCSEKDMGMFKDKIVDVLKAGGFEQKRPSKMSNKELLYLLSLFNQAGIRFHDKGRKRKFKL